MPKDERRFVMLVGSMENVPQLRFSSEGRPHCVGTLRVHNSDRYFRVLFYDGHAENIAVIARPGLILDIHGWIAAREGREIVVERFRVIRE